jgi:hypothetical protein
MIIKSLTLKRTEGIGNLVRYIFDDEKMYFDEESKDLVYRYNLLKGDIQSYIQQFKANLQSIANNNKRVQLYHFILSFSPSSTPYLNTKKLRQLTRKFIGLYNHSGAFLAVAQKHGDLAEHVHVHLLSTGISISSGKALRLTKQRFSEIQQELQIHIKNRYPELAASLVNYGQKEREENHVEHTEYHLKKNNRVSKKLTFKEKLEKLVLKSSSKEEFETLLKDAQIKPYFRNGKLVGYVDPQSNRKYRISTLQLSPALETLAIKEQEAQIIHYKTKEKEEEAYRKTTAVSKAESQQTQYQDILKELEEIRMLSEERDDFDLER